MKLLRIPPFFVANRGEQSTKVALMLSAAEQRFVVRLTGGCGHMSPSDARDLYELMVESFVLADFRGALLYGGTRMVRRDDPDVVVPGITEIPPLVAARCPVVTMGVVPRTGDLAHDNRHGIIVSQEIGNDFITVVHPAQATFVIVQQSVDVAATWDTEWQECLQIISEMVDYAGWRQLLLCYNGGGVTERELLAWAKKDWPVLLVAGSGRTTEKYSQDVDFLSTHPNVRVVEKDSRLIAKALRNFNEVKELSNEKVFHD